MPSNEHRQLVVIDFEYAGANLPGFEFANHFVSPARLSSEKGFWRVFLTNLSPLV
jgi:thiamine kinase-like enzyme